MNMTYHIEAARDGEKCQVCGEPADIVIVADTHERETGHIDEIPLCEDHKMPYLNPWVRGEN